MTELYPRMDEQDIIEIKKIINARLTMHRYPVILEWGAGDSTIIFSNFLKDLRFMHNQQHPFQWYSIENSLDWIDKVKKEKNEFVTLINKSLDSKEYIEPKIGYVNLVIIDGRRRVECAQHAKRWLVKGGYVLIHDADREKYHEAFKLFKDGKFLTKTLWRGTNG